MTTEKVCTKCQQVQPLESFSRDSGKRDGRTGFCKTCATAITRSWAAQNPERRRLAASAWDARNREKISAGKRRRWAELSVDERSARKRREHGARRARRLSAGVLLPIDVYRDILASGSCVYCDLSADEIDHVRPLARGGQELAHNLVPSCCSCNRSKCARLLTEWDPVRVQHAVERSPKVTAELARLATEMTSSEAA